MFVIERLARACMCECEYVRIRASKREREMGWERNSVCVRQWARDQTIYVWTKPVHMEKERNETHETQTPKTQQVVSYTQRTAYTHHMQWNEWEWIICMQANVCSHQLHTHSDWNCDVLSDWLSCGCGCVCVSACACVFYRRFSTIAERVMCDTSERRHTKSAPIHSILNTTTM